MSTNRSRRRASKTKDKDPVDLSNVRRRKINARKTVIKSRKDLSSKKKNDTFTAYSNYLKMITKEVSTIQSIIKKIKEMTDEFSRLDE
jgi:hypothetical protein